jgi:hypothetical protein
MSNKIVVDTGKSYFGAQIVEASKVKLDANVKIHLFVNNYTIIETTVLANLTEASYGGYAAQTATGWTDGGIDGSDRDTWTGPALTFQATSSSGLPQTIYGMYATDSGGTVLLWAENFSPTITLASSGDGFTVTPQFSVGSIF